MAPHDHADKDRPPQDSFWTSRAFLVCAVLLVVAGFLLWTEHLAHALGYLPFLLVLACPVMHIFMHGGHGHSHTPSKRPSDGETS